VCHIINSIGDEANLSAALPALVTRGWHSESAVRAIGAIAVSNPHEVVRSGGLTTLLVKVGMAPDAIVSLYREDRACTCDHEVLAYMHCRVDLPPGADDTMRRIFNTSPMDVIHLYAKTYDLARPHINAPPWPILPAFDLAHVGAVQLVSADGEAHVTLLAPIARAAGFVSAHARSEPGAPIKVPLTGAKTVELLNALMYDEYPTDNDSLTALATVANMWCAPTVVHHCIDRLARDGDIYGTVELAGDWPAVAGLLRYHCKCRLSELEGWYGRPEALARLIWPSAS
jgi:hypothetical protein